jgi:methyltransferase (TIGR00027 family)
MKNDEPSATAILVAGNVAFIAATPSLSHLVPPEMGALTTLLLEAYQAPRFRVHKLYERVSIPGLALHQVLRKRFIEDSVRKGIADGYSQVVVLGGGLDTLTLRLHREFPDVRFIELDHPATQRIKYDVVRNRGMIGPNLSFHAVDLTAHPVTTALSAIGDYDAGRRTIFVCEGVLMYLSADEVDKVLAEFGRQAEGARFIFTFMEHDASGRPAFRNATFLVRLWLALKKEPFTWGLPRTAIQGFLRARSFEMVVLATDETLRNEYLGGDAANETIAQGELVCVADAVR